jgi:hypothetical protein
MDNTRAYIQLDCHILIRTQPQFVVTARKMQGIVAPYRAHLGGPEVLGLGLSPRIAHIE